MYQVILLAALLSSLPLTTAYTAVQVPQETVKQNVVSLDRPSLLEKARLFLENKGFTKEKGRIALGLAVLVAAITALSAHWNRDQSYNMAWPLGKLSKRLWGARGNSWQLRREIFGGAPRTNTDLGMHAIEKTYDGMLHHRYEANFKRIGYHGRHIEELQKILPAEFFDTYKARSIPGDYSSPEIDMPKLKNPLMVPGNYSAPYPTDTDFPDRHKE